MTPDCKEPHQSSAAWSAPQPPGRRGYATPCLRPLGRLADLTLGSPNGAGDSGASIPERAPGTLFMTNSLPPIDY